MNRARRIPVVDDGEMVRHALLEILGWLGYEMDAVSSGEEALAAFDEARHALLITDHCMPGMLPAPPLLGSPIADSGLKAEVSPGFR